MVGQRGEDNRPTHGEERFAVLITREIHDRRWAIEIPRRLGWSPAEQDGDHESKDQTEPLIDTADRLADWNMSNTSSNGRERLSLVVEALPSDVPPIIRLRRFLKLSLRTFRLKAITVEPVGPVDNLPAGCQNTSAGRESDPAGGSTTTTPNEEVPVMATKQCSRKSLVSSAVHVCACRPLRR